MNQLSGKLTEQRLRNHSYRCKCSRQVSAKDFEQEGEVGVYDTAKLKRLLVVGDEINVEVVEKNEKNVSINVSDDTTSVNFMLADLAVIPNVPLKDLLNFDLQFLLTMTSQEVRSFSKCIE